VFGSVGSTEISLLADHVESEVWIACSVGWWLMAGADLF
jgi:hypothetical protein